MEHALLSYVKGQLALSVIIGASSGIGLWILGMTGLMPNGGKYALIFGVWAGITELIPYIGPWLGAAPPVLYALVQHPLSALWVVLLFLGIQQLEGHVIVPKVMGHSLRLHPLLVIFGLLAGGEIYGFPGILVALPLLAAGRAVWEFFSERLAFAALGQRRCRRGRRRRGRRRQAGHADCVSDCSCAPSASHAATAMSRRLHRPTSSSPPARRLRSSGRTAPASRRCSRCSPARSSRAKGRSTRMRAGRLGAAASCALRAAVGAREPRALRPARRRRGRRKQSRRSCSTRFSLPADGRASGELSVGNRQRLNVALSLLGEPRVLLLDEPTASLDPGQRRRVWEVVDALRGDGGAVCFATQNLEEVEHADRVLVLLDGRIVPSTPEEVFR